MTISQRSLEKAREISGGHFYDDNDCWYSCPLCEEGCCNDAIPKNECTCDYTRRVERIATALDEARNQALEEAAKIAEDRPRFDIYKKLRAQDEIAKAIRQAQGRSE